MKTVLLKRNEITINANVIAHASNNSGEKINVNDVYDLSHYISRTVIHDLVFTLLLGDSILVRTTDASNVEETELEYIILSNKDLIKSLYEINSGDQKKAEYIFKNLGLQNKGYFTRLSAIADIIRERYDLSSLLNNIEYFYKQYITLPEYASDRYASVLEKANNEITVDTVVKAYEELVSNGKRYGGGYSDSRDYFCAREDHKIFGIYNFFEDINTIFEGSGAILKNKMFGHYNPLLKEQIIEITEKIFELVKIEDEASPALLDAIADDSNIINLILVGITKYNSERSEHFWKILKYICKTGTQSNERRHILGLELGLKQLIFSDVAAKTTAETVQEFKRYANTEFPLTENVDGTEFTENDLMRYEKLYKDIFGVCSAEYLIFLACNDLFYKLEDELLLDKSKVFKTLEEFTVEARKGEDNLLKESFKNLYKIVIQEYGSDIKYKSEEYIKLGIIGLLPEKESAAVADFFSLDVEDLKFVNDNVNELIQAKNSEYSHGGEYIEPSSYFTLFLLNEVLVSYVDFKNNINNPAFVYVSGPDSVRDYLNGALVRLLNRAIKKSVVVSENNVVPNKRYLNMLISIIHRDHFARDDMKDVGCLISECIVKHVLPNKIKRELIFGYNKKIGDGEGTNTNSEHRIVEQSMRNLFNEAYSFSFNQICGATSSEIADHILSSGEELDKHLMAQFTKESLI